MAGAAKQVRRGLVLGGGGMLGAAWMTGALSVLAEALGWDPRESEMIVGTSAGSVLAALLGAGASAEDLKNHQLTGRLGTGPLRDVDFDYATVAGGAVPERPKLTIGSRHLLAHSARHPRSVPPTAVFAAALPVGRGSLSGVREMVAGLPTVERTMPERAVGVAPDPEPVKIAKSHLKPHFRAHAKTDAGPETTAEARTDGEAASAGLTADADAATSTLDAPALDTLATPTFSIPGAAATLATAAHPATSGHPTSPDTDPVALGPAAVLAPDPAALGPTFAGATAPDASAPDASAPGPSTSPDPTPPRRVAWSPHKALRIVALDYDAGRRTVFGAPDVPPADLADAVTASCSIPGWFAPVEIGGRRYVDGGMWSATNVDIAAARNFAEIGEEKLDELYVLAPMAVRGFDGPPASVLERAVRRYRRGVTKRMLAEVQRVRADGTRVVVFCPSPADLKAIGQNMMDAGRRPAVLETSLRTTREQLEAAWRGRSGSES